MSWTALSRQSIWFKLAYFFAEEKDIPSSTNFVEFFARCFFTVIALPFWALAHYGFWVVIHYSIVLPLLYCWGFLIGSRPIMKGYWFVRYKMYEWVRIYKIRPIYLLIPSLICYLLLVYNKVIDASDNVFIFSQIFVVIVLSLACAFGFLVFVAVSTFVVFAILASICVIVRFLFNKLLMITPRIEFY